MSCWSRLRSLLVKALGLPAAVGGGGKLRNFFGKCGRAVSGAYTMADKASKSPVNKEFQQEITTFPKDKLKETLIKESNLLPDAKTIEDEKQRAKEEAAAQETAAQ
ncbi:hypothetical protein scyTo_0008096 [Scyliorhinus torazame]|uniref:ATP synthase-coupling factor 6, mitochondrial n=1 Tax=Scyliorhinus torazame TaxID=75743 RepID=A0A401P3F8_SCYTO|nr:hypothetical protein [Scyliorhinus torazame]